MDDHRQLHHQKKHSAVVGRGLPEHINQAKIEWFTWKFDSTRMSMLKKKKKKHMLCDKSDWSSFPPAAGIPGSPRHSVAANASASEHLTERLQSQLRDLPVSLCREQLHHKRESSGKALSATRKHYLLMAPSLPNSKQDEQGSSAPRSVTSSYQEAAPWGL